MKSKKVIKEKVLGKISPDCGRSSENSVLKKSHNTIAELFNKSSEFENLPETWRQLTANCINEGVSHE